jgi:hypothetical protein
MKQCSSNIRNGSNEDGSDHLLPALLFHPRTVFTDGQEIPRTPGNGRVVPVENPFHHSSCFALLIW